MLDRESTFANEEIVELIKTKFIPVAIDQAYQRRQQDTEGDFWRKIVQQSPRKNFGNATTQGLFAADANGTFLGYTNHRGPDRVLQMLEKSVSDFKPATTAKLEREKVDERFNPEPPKDGFIVRVRAKVLSGYDETDDHWRKIFQSALSRDNMWVTGEEHKILVSGKFPETLARRMARYHLIDNTRGEPPMWRKQEVGDIDLTMKGNQLIGSIQLATGNGKRGFDADIFGMIEAESGKVTRFDIVATGDFHGEGTYTRGAPKGKFPLAVAFELADGSDTADAIPPQASRGWLRGYLEELE